MIGSARTIEAIFAAGTAAALTLGYIVFVGRTIGPVQNADFSASLSLIYLFAIALTPITPALARIVSALGARGDHAAIHGVRRDVMRRAILWLGGLAVLGLALSPWIARALRFPSGLTFSLALSTAVLFALLGIDRGVVQGLMRFRAYNANVLIESTVRCLGAVALFALLPKTADTALASYLVAVVVAEAALAVLLRKEWKTDEVVPADWDAIKRLALPMFALMICVAVFQNADMLAVKRWLSAVETGLYGAATALAKGFGVMFVPLYVISGPTLVALHDSKKPLLGTVLRFEAWFLLACLIPLGLYWFFPEQILRLLYGQAFEGAARFLVPLGGLSILTHSSLMLVQLLITVHDFRFLRVYAGVVVVQIVALMMFHRTAAQILAVLYVGQSAVLLAVLLLVALHHTKTGDH